VNPVAEVLQPIVSVILHRASCAPEPTTLERVSEFHFFPRHPPYRTFRAGMSKLPDAGECVSGLCGHLRTIQELRDGNASQERTSCPARNSSARHLGLRLPQCPPASADSSNLMAVVVSGAIPTFTAILPSGHRKDHVAPVGPKLIIGASPGPLECCVLALTAHIAGHATTNLSIGHKPLEHIVGSSQAHPPQCPKPASTGFTVRSHATTSSETFGCAYENALALCEKHRRQSGGHRELIGPLESVLIAQIAADRIATS